MENLLQTPSYHCQKLKKKISYDVKERIGSMLHCMEYALIIWFQTEIVRVPEKFQFENL